MQSLTLDNFSDRFFLNDNISPQFFSAVNRSNSNRQQSNSNTMAMYPGNTPFPSAAEFEQLGCNLAHSCACSAARRFKAHFGVDPNLCVTIWNRIANNGAFVYFTTMHPPNPKHLLWALLFMKLYSSVSVLASMCRVDDKTFRKWTWFYVDAIAALDEQLVCTIASLLAMFCH